MPVSSESTHATSPGADPKTVQLGQLHPLSGGDVFVSGGQNVNATRYDRTLHADDLECGYSGQSYQLDHKYATFQSDIGLGDATEGNDVQVNFTVDVDGHEKSAITVGLGKIEHLKIPVGGAFRLEIGAESVRGACSADKSVAVWIDPKLIG